MKPSKNRPNQPDHHTGSTAGAGSQHQQLNAMDRFRREATPKCPRCSSTDTTFSFYANRKRSQPRYLCKSCQRHWTLGGALRNVRDGVRRRWSLNSRVSLDQPPLRFNSSSLNNAAWGLDYGQVNYNSTSASMGGGGRSSLSGGGSAGATGSILFAPGLEQPQVPQTPLFPSLGGLEASPGSLCPFESSDSVAGGPQDGAGGASIRPMVSTSGVTTQLASGTMEDNQQLNLAMQFMGMSEQYRNNIGGGSGTATTSAWPWTDL